GFQAQGPTPVTGFFSKSLSPIFSPSIRSIAEEWAFAGPTSGLRIVSKRVCSEGGNAAQSIGAENATSSSSTKRRRLRRTIIRQQRINPTNEERDPVNPMQTNDRPTYPTRKAFSQRDGRVIQKGTTNGREYT